MSFIHKDSAFIRLKYPKIMMNIRFRSLVVKCPVSDMGDLDDFFAKKDKKRKGTKVKQIFTIFFLTFFSKR